MNMLANAYQIEFGGQTLWLDPSGAVYRPGTDSHASRLLVADLHLGREATLQQAGISLPNGGTSRTLERLTAVLENYQPAELWILGDLVHARDSLTETNWNEIRSVLARLARDSIHLIEGNHDRPSRCILSELLTIHTAPVLAESIWLAHDAKHDFIEAKIRPEKHPVIAGHVHPGYCIPDTGQRLKCFHYQPNLLTVPAFGEQTGTTKVTRTANANVLFATGTSVIPWPSPGM
ncbi:MAG: ligase-associated DNA damage response endonuclease PdeM [Planctomycetales bacterium]|nr:ligase-associated DNA damage response endonuclease PdeM [Planctomycetales bacterium]